MNIHDPSDGGLFTNFTIKSSIVSALFSCAVIAGITVKFFPFEK
nr:MAG TPA: hypothetical protein [Herelleviridae sp.]